MLIRIWIEIYLVVTFAGLLQVKNFSTESTELTINTAFGCLFFALSVLTPLLVLGIVGMKKDVRRM